MQHRAAQRPLSRKSYVVCPKLRYSIVVQVKVGSYEVAKQLSWDVREVGVTLLYLVLVRLWRLEVDFGAALLNRSVGENKMVRTVAAYDLLPLPPFFFFSCEVPSAAFLVSI
jgi:hypothetical protein